uniref:GCVT N-terminal domain-containing protein n=1 Tax=Araucaria cunninghamii TaxID=56994 RepID=A0A0D6R7B7_ARACU
MTSLSSSATSYYPRFSTLRIGPSWKPPAPRAGTGNVIVNHFTSEFLLKFRLVKAPIPRPRRRRTLSLSVSAASAFDLVPPPIDNDLHAIMMDMGAKFSEDGSVETFGNDELSLKAMEDGIVAVDLSHFGRIRVSGDDRLQFMHNQSTADFHFLAEGQGCDTVFVTPTARTTDLAIAWVMKNAITLLVSPTTCGRIVTMLNKYIFFADKVEVQDITSKTCFFSIMGPRSDQVMEHLNIGAIVGKPYGTHLHYSVDGNPITVGVGSVVSERGYSFLLSPPTAGLIWKSLMKFGAVPMGMLGWERLRVLQGRPAPGKELTDEFNVLEAGLWKTLSLTKGCYIGQETIARLITYDGVKQHLWGIHLDSPATLGSIIRVDGTKVGKLTSFALGSNGLKHVGLGYVKRNFGFAGQVVNIEDTKGVLVDVPFICRSFQKEEEMAKK